MAKRSDIVPGADTVTKLSWLVRRAFYDGVKASPKGVTPEELDQLWLMSTVRDFRERVLIDYEHNEKAEL